MNDCIVVKSMRDANKMLELGNQIKHIDRDINNRKYLIFLFYKTDKSIKDLQRQVPYLLIPAFKDGQGNSVRKTEYVADFVYTDVATGNTIIADSKGSEFNIDPVFKLKFKMLKEKFKDRKDIEFQVIIKYKDVWYNLENKEEKKKYKEIYKNRKKKTKK